jgi:ribosomal protein S6E (S10)
MAILEIIRHNGQIDVQAGPAPGGMTVMIADPDSGKQIHFPMDNTTTDRIRNKMIAANSDEQKPRILGADGEALSSSDPSDTSPVLAAVGGSSRGGSSSRPPQQRRRSR